MVFLGVGGDFLFVFSLLIFFVLFWGGGGVVAVEGA